MKLKYSDKKEFIDIEQSISISIDKIRIIGSDIPTNTSGFELYDDDEITIIQSFSDYKVIYEVGDGFVDFTNDENIYYVFYSHDYDGYFYSHFISTESTMERSILIKQGQGKEFAEAIPDIEFFDKDGLANYKAVYIDDKLSMVEISADEKAAKKLEIISQEFNACLNEKIYRLSQYCSGCIDNGIDYKDKHYSYAITDQNNLKNAVELAKVTNLDVPYHADNESCTLYSFDDMINIYILNQTNLTHHTTYFNQLKLYTQSLSLKKEIDSVVYGQQLTGEYLENYIMIMTQSKKIISAYLGVDESIVDEMLGTSVNFASAPFNWISNAHTIILTNSSLVTVPLPRNVPSLYPFIIPIVARVSIYSLAHSVSDISLNDFFDGITGWGVIAGPWNDEPPPPPFPRPWGT